VESIKSPKEAADDALMRIEKYYPGAIVVANIKGKYGG